jgi:Xaa-Pro dipeptidase
MSNPLPELYRSHLRTIAARTDAALGATGFDALAVCSGDAPIQFLDDNPYPFKVNPHFKAWVPLTSAPRSWLMYRPGARPVVVFYQPEDYWHAPPATPAEHWVEDVDLIVVRDASAARAHVPRGRVACIADPDVVPDWGFAEVNPRALLDRLHFTRAVKTAYEVECMRRATALGVRGHAAAAAAFHEGASEFAAHVAYLETAGLEEEELPYTNIIAFNEHGAVLHYTRRDRAAPPAPERRAFLIDAGAQFRGYACDITRTHVADQGVFADLVHALDREQQSLCAAVRPGVDYAAIHLDAHRRIAGLLRDAGLITQTSDDAVASGLSSVFFPHGIGHLIGLQVHDVAGFMITPDGTEKSRPSGHPFLRLTRSLEPGFVVTIEPGIYFIDLLLEAARQNDLGRHIVWREVDRLRRYGGMRIEDDVVCTPSLPENLTRAAFAASA